MRSPHEIQTQLKSSRAHFMPTQSRAICSQHLPRLSRSPLIPSHDGSAAAAAAHKSGHRALVARVGAVWCDWQPLAIAITLPPINCVDIPSPHRRMPLPPVPCLFFQYLLLCGALRASTWSASSWGAVRASRFIKSLKRDAKFVFC